MKRLYDGTLNVREINASSISQAIGTPEDRAVDNTIIGLLKSIVIELHSQNNN